MQRHEYKKALDLTPLSMRGTFWQSAIQNAEALMETKYGKPVSVDRPDWSINISNGVASTKLTYPVSCSRGQTKVTVIIQHFGGRRYFVTGFFVNL
jgi:hypothetical protein